MPINSLEFASRFTGELDRKFVQGAQTGFFADNVFGAKFVNAKTVVIPDAEFVGLAKYDRDKGYMGSGFTVGQTTYEITQDRSRSMDVDAMDYDETGIAEQAGRFLTGYVEEMVVPEMDAYVLSKLAGIASERGHTTVYNANKAVSQFITAVNNLRSRIGEDKELVAFVDYTMLPALELSPEIQRQITVSDFKKGDINLKVKSINGVVLIPVVNDRMRDAYDFLEGSEPADGELATGGFVPTETAGYIRTLIIPKKGASLVKKTEKIRVFTPEQNLNKDAYKFCYRVYYDIFVKKSKLDSIETIITEGAAAASDT